VSIITGLLAARALGDVEAIYWSKSAEFFSVEATLEAGDFVDGVPRKARPLRLQVGGDGGFVPDAGGLGKKRALEIDAVVNCCHGGPGEDGTLQGALDLAGIRYTGPSAAGAALGMDKLAFAAAVQAGGLAHLPVVALDPTNPGDAPFDGPYIVKPRFGGSSIGIEVLADWQSVAAFVRSPQPNLRSGAVVEPYRSDSFDLNVAVRTYPEVQLSAIEKPVRRTASAGILGYKDKYVGGEGMLSAPRELPAAISPDWQEQIRDAARRIVTIAGVRGMARIDFLADGDELVVNEINTIPGSLSVYLWVEPAVSVAQLLRDLVAEAMSGPGRAYSTQGADGTALRSAGSIAGKLG